MRIIDLKCSVAVCLHSITMRLPFIVKAFCPYLPFREALKRRLLFWQTQLKYLKMFIFFFILFILRIPARMFTFLQQKRQNVQLRHPINAGFWACTEKRYERRMNLNRIIFIQQS